MLDFGYIIEKRDLTKEDYSQDKIVNALKTAFRNTNTCDNSIPFIINDIEDEIKTYGVFNNTKIINIETIQNIVEKYLMQYKYYDVAKHYITYRVLRAEARKNETYVSKINEDISPPWGPLGYVTYKRTYSRRLSDTTEQTEEFKDTILRVLDASQKQLNVGFTNKELRDAYKYFMELKCSVAGRFLWQLGTKTVDNLGLMSLQNCAFVKIDSPIQPFLWTFDVLMLGTGVGFSVENHNVSKLPPVLNKQISITRLDTKDADFIVPDSREGWVSLLEKTLEAYFYKGKSFSYSTVLIRSRGQKIHGFGGLASGPESLVKLVETVQIILNRRLGQKLSSVDCLDLVNIIATCVVAGNVRRCLGENSLVHCKAGLKKIKDVTIGEEVLTSNGYERVLNKFEQGVQELVTIKTQDGEFECTPNHKMAVYKSLYEVEWKMAQDLKAGDRLMTSRRSIDGSKTELPTWSYERPNNHSTTCKDITIPELDADLAWFIGNFHADGNTYPNFENNGAGAYVCVACDGNKPELANKIKEQMQRFGSNLHITTKKRDNDNCFRVHCQSKQLAWYFANNIKKANTTLVIPEFIKFATRDIKLGYLAGVLDGDGSVGGRGKVLVSSVYLEWVKELQVLCYSCGFETRLHKMDTMPPSRKKHWKPLHRLNIITDHAKGVINSIPQLFSKFEFSPLNKGNKHNSFPIEFVRDEFSSTTKINPSMKKMRIDTYEELFGEILACPVEVIDLVYTGKVSPTYDIEVENMHEFYCDGYLTHNSALIAIGDPNDIEYLMAKRWDLGTVPNWRCMSNNSVNCSSIDQLADEFWEGYKGNGEPYGLVNMDLCRKTGRLKDFGKYPDPEVEGFNPCCFSGDTLIAVADGRGGVPIRQLAEEDTDVPVYSIDADGVVCIKMGRAPRLTIKEAKIVKITLDDDTTIKTTLDHKFILKTGETIEAQNLTPGMSLPRFDKTPYNVKNQTYYKINKNIDNNSTEAEHRMIAKFNYPNKFNSTKYNDCCAVLRNTNGVIVHHKDRNGLNNCLDNLEVMTNSEHLRLHNMEDDHSGSNNSMYGRKHTNETKKLIGKKTAERYTSDEYKKNMSDKIRAHYVNNPEARNNLSAIRQQEYDKWCLEKMKETDLETIMVDGILNVKKSCENCNCELILPYTLRGVSYCSLNCSNTSKKAIENRRVSRNTGVENKQKNTLHKQVMIYKDLQEKLNRNPLKREWEKECSSNNVPYRIRVRGETPSNEHGLKSYSQLKKLAEGYNHRVKRVEFLDETEDVYNITVDDNHTLAVVTSKTQNKYSGIFTSQCEQNLANFETCCLSEIFLPNVDNFGELIGIATVLYRICKHSLLLSCHQGETEDIVHKNMRMGIGVTGYLQCEQYKKDWLSPLYEYLRGYDEEYSAKLGCPTSVKLTTCKPSGTLSILPGVTPGCHPGIYKYFIRRIRIASENSLIELCRNHGYKIEYQRNFDGTEDRNTMIVEFPCRYPEGTRLANDMSAVDQLNVVKELQSNWSDNAVSCTVYYRLNELDSIKNYLRENYTNCVKSCSFLLHSDHGFDQAPYEEISEEAYNELVSKTKPIVSGTIDQADDDQMEVCKGGMCPLR